MNSLRAKWVGPQQKVKTIKEKSGGTRLVNAEIQNNRCCCWQMFWLTLFPPIIWMFTESDGIKSRLSSKIFATLPFLWVFVSIILEQRSVSMTISYLIICLNESIYISVYAIACDVANSSALLAANECWPCAVVTQISYRVEDCSRTTCKYHGSWPFDKPTPHDL